MIRVHLGTGDSRLGQSGYLRAARTATPAHHVIGSGGARSMRNALHPKGRLKQPDSIKPCRFRHSSSPSEERQQSIRLFASHGCHGDDDARGDAHVYSGLF
ncbi:hypothetical protein TNCV_2797481 [Trichonephila clavipes]|nr:hypothetical protein TNCV_2797481 [Trichonephila clavipes]